MRSSWLLGILTGCGYISEESRKLRLDPDQDGVPWLEDCDDTDGAVGRPTIWYVDDDNDGFGDTNNVVEACTQPEGAVDRGADCNDSDASIYPGAPDIFYDGVDSNCDGVNDCDQDGDGFCSDSNACPDSVEDCPDTVDCDDEDAAIYPDPSLSEIYFNGADDDCDFSTGDGDADGDSFWNADYEQLVQANGEIPLPIPDGKEGDCYDSLENPLLPINGFSLLQPQEVHPQAEERYYDGIDQDCAGDILADFDQDGDGQNTLHYPDTTGVSGSDCVDSTEDPGYLASSGVEPADIYENALDLAYDGVDANCDGRSDFDADQDGFTIAELDCDGDGTFESMCDLNGDSIADYVGQGDCNDSDSSINIAAEEGIADGIDQDCNGFELCYEDFDEDTFGNPQEEVQSTVLSCLATGVSANDSDCDDADSFTYPGANEICDGDINDCGGSLPTDEIDLDNDGYIECTVHSSGLDDQSLVGGDDCEPQDVTIFPTATEVPADGIDQNCDDVDDCYEDFDGDGIGGMVIISGSDLTCSNPGESSFMDDCDDTDEFSYPGAAETDDGSGVDNNCDGMEALGFTSCESTTSTSGAYFLACTETTDPLNATAVDQSFAQGLCTAQGYDGLATLLDTDEQTTLSNLLTSTGSTPFWIGLSDEASEGTLAWIDGTIYDETSTNPTWSSPGTPDLTIGDCVTIDPVSVEWSVQDCASSQAFVCSSR